MKLTLLTILAIATLCGCSSADDGPPSAPTTTGKIAPCVTAGASYLTHYVEHPGGTCGPLSDGVINTSPGGDVTTNGASCTGDNRIDGCDVYATNLTCTTPNGKVVQNGKTTWAADGSSATGTIQNVITLNDGNSCVSSYDLTITRQ